MGKINMKLMQGVKGEEQAIETSKEPKPKVDGRKVSYTDEQMDEALKEVYRTGRQQDGADYLKINKGTFSKKIREIEEKEPERVERLKAEAAAENEALAKVAGTSAESIKYSRIILKHGTPEQIERAEQQGNNEENIKKIAEEITAQDAQKPETAPEPQEPIKSTPAEEKAEEKPNTKPQKQTFSFRADQSKIENWKAYAEATGQDIGTLWTAAIDEYINSHELTADQKAIYELQKQAAEMARKAKNKK